jgi:hypothetical protein
MQQINIKTPLRVAFSGSVKGITEGSRDWDSIAANCEFLWSPHIFQFRTRIGGTAFMEKKEIWDFSTSAAVRFKQGRLSLRVASPDFPEKWNITVSWRLERTNTF